MADKSDTPRTDAIVNCSERTNYDFKRDMITLARTLERELAAAQEKAAEQGRYACELFDEAKRCQRELTAAQSAKEELLVALREADSAIEALGYINADWERAYKARQTIDALINKHGA